MRETAPVYCIKCHERLTRVVAGNMIDFQHQTNCKPTEASELKAAA